MPQIIKEISRHGGTNLCYKIFARSGNTRNDTRSTRRYMDRMTPTLCVLAIGLDIELDSLAESNRE
jgi:hypothetical protein